MANNLGSLTVHLGLDAAQFSSGISKAEYQARKLGEEIGSQIRSGALIAAGAFASIGFAATKAFDAIQKQVNDLDAFNDLADASGASIENISALDRVARQTGATFETAESVLVKFNQALANAKPDNDAGRLLQALNLNISQLKALDPAEALRQTAVAFSKFTDDGNKARAMQELFGKSVKEAAPFLKDLAEQEALVGTTSATTAAQAEIFNKQLFALQANATDAARSIVADLLPALSRALTNFTDLKNQGNLGLIVKDAAKDLVGLGKLTGDNGADIKNFMKERERIQKSIDFANRKGFPVDGFKRDMEEITRYLEVARTKQRNEVNAMFSGQDFGDAISRKFNKSPSLPDFAKPPKAPGAGGRTSALTDPTAEAQRYIETLQKQLERTQDLTVQEQVLRDLQMGRLGQVTSAQKDELLNIAGQIDAAKALTEQRKLDTKALEEQAAAQKALMDEGTRLYEQTRTPLEQFNASQDRLNSLLEAGAIDFVTAARAGQMYKKQLDDATKTVSEMDEFTKNAAQNIQSTLGDTFAKAMEGNWKDIGKGFTSMLNRMIAEAAAADLTRKLFGQAAGGTGEGWLGSLLGAFGSSMGFGRASGGMVEPWSLHPVNENGPEEVHAPRVPFKMLRRREPVFA